MGSGLRKLSQGFLHFTNTSAAVTAPSSTIGALLSVQQVLIICGSDVLESRSEYGIREYRTTAPRGDLGAGSCEPVVTPFPPSSQCITCCMCVSV